MSPPVINYAHSTGYSSLPAAIIFTLLYTPLFLWFLKKSFTHPSYVHFELTLFCSIRVAAFIVRAVLLKSDIAGTNLGLVVADQILFAVGYFSLLHSAYTLVLDWEQIIEKKQARYINPIIRLIKNRWIFRISLATAVALGVTASSNVKPDGTLPSYATALRETSTIIFLVMTTSLVVLAVYFARNEMSKYIAVRNPSAFITTNPIRRVQVAFGTKHRILILITISLLLLAREMFVAVTMTSSTRSKQYNEHFWYPFVATTEILAVFCCLAPGLIPSAKEIQEMEAVDLRHAEEHELEGFH